jgi:hypothetical protein
LIVIVSYLLQRYVMNAKYKTVGVVVSKLYDIDDG